MPYMDTGFIGVSPGQLASYQSNSAYNEMNLERRRKDNAEQRARAYAAQQQQADIEGKRTLAADQYGYSAALADQEAGNRYGLANQNYIHEDELFERHAAAQISRMRLEQIQQEKMAAIQREAQMERDYLQQDFQQQNVAQSQEFIAGQADKRFEQEKEIGGIQHQYGMENIDLQHQNLLETNSQLAQQHVVEEAFHNQYATQLKAVEQAIEYGYHSKSFKEENMAKAKTILEANRQRRIEENRQGIANGTHEYLSSKDAQDMMVNLPNAISEVDNDPSSSEDEKYAVKLQIYNKMDEIDARARRIPEAKRAQSNEVKLQKLIETIPASERNKPWKLDKEGTGLELPRGWKSETPSGPLSNDEIKSIRDQYGPGYENAPVKRGPQGIGIIDVQAWKAAEAIKNPKPTFYQTMAALDERQSKTFQEMEKRQLTAIENSRMNAQERNDFDVFQQALKQVDETFVPKKIPLPKEEGKQLMSPSTWFNDSDRDPTPEEAMNQRYEELKKLVPAGNTALKRYAEGMRGERAGNTGVLPQGVQPQKRFKVNLQTGTYEPVTQ